MLLAGKVEKSIFLAAENGADDGKALRIGFGDDEQACVKIFLAELISYLLCE